MNNCYEKSIKFIHANIQSILLVLVISISIHLMGFYISIIVLTTGYILIKFEKNILLLFALLFLGLSIPLSILGWQNNSFSFVSLMNEQEIIENLLIYAYDFIGLYLISLILDRYITNRYKITIRLGQIVEKGHNWKSSLTKIRIVNLMYLYYIFLAYIVLYPILGRGYVFALDMIYASEITQLNGPQYASGLSISIYAQKLLSFALPVDIIQKIILFMTVFATGIGMHKFLPTENKTLKYLAGTFYIFNPFFYERLWAGQIGICLAYAVMPWAVGMLIKFLQEPGMKTAIKLSLLTTLLIILALHWIFIFGLVVVVLSVNYYLRYRDKIKLNAYKKPALMVGLSLLMLNLYWLIPNILSKGSTSSFGTSDFSVFAPAGDEVFGHLFNVTALYGFWGEDAIYTAKNYMSFWPIFTLIFLWLSFMGFMYHRKDKKIGWLVNSLAILFVVSIILASGVGSHYTGWFNGWLLNHIPFYAGLRDTQKWTSVTALCYAILIPLGLVAIFDMYKKQLDKNKQLWITLAVIALVITNTFTLLRGLNGDYFTTDYPKSWYATNEMLNKDKDEFKVLFLPWHGYMSFDFTEKIVANPAQLFFDKPVIQGDNIERGALYTHSSNPDSKKIEDMIKLQKNIAKTLKDMNVKYVILSKSADWESYGYLYKQKGLSLVKEYEDLTIFENDLY